MLAKCVEPHMHTRVSMHEIIYILVIFHMQILRPVIAVRTSAVCKCTDAGITFHFCKQCIIATVAKVVFEKVFAEDIDPEAYCMVRR